MTSILWGLVIISFYIVFSFYRAKVGINTLREATSDFANNNEYLNVPRSLAPAKMIKFIKQQEFDILNQNYKLLLEGTKPKKKEQNYHVVYVSPTSDTLIELVYEKLTFAQRMFLALFFSPLCLNPEITIVGVETNYSNGEAVFTSTVNDSPFPRWVHTTFLKQDAKIIDLLDAHYQKRKELEETKNLTPIKVQTVEDFYQKEKSQRERLSRHMQLEFEQLIEESGTEFLLEDRDPK